MKIYKSILSKHLLSFLFFLLPFLAYNQTRGGLLFDEKAYERIPLSKKSITKGTILPNSVDLTCYAPYAHNQGGTNSCVGWAIANALTLYRAIAVGETRRARIDTDMRYSASFIYNQIRDKGDCKGGARFIDGLELITQKGACLNSTFSSHTSCAEMPTRAAFDEALQHKLATQYSRVFSNKKDKILSTKRQLAQGNPVIIGFNSAPNMRKYRSARIWYPDMPTSESLNGHAMVVVGYDEEGFNLLNSYGPSWGEEGLIKILYDQYAQFAQEGYVLEFKAVGKGAISKNTMPYEFKAGLKLQYASNETSTPADFETLPLSFSKDLHHYQYVNGAWLLEEVPVRLAITIPSGISVYAFNMDGQSNVIDLGVIQDNAQLKTVFLPSQTEGYTFPQRGTELICLLFTYQKIEAYTEKLERLQGLKPEEIGTVLTDLFKLIPLEKIEYNPTTPFFNVATVLGEGIGVSVILSINLD